MSKEPYSDNDIVAGEQRLPRRVTLLLAVAALLVFFHASARAQNVELYLALAREYAAGRGEIGRASCRERVYACV